MSSRSTRNPLRRSPRELRRRLNALSDRHGGAHAITQATRAIPQAYRRLDPDRPSPAEELTLKRLIRGQYRSRGVLRDALLIATVDTEVGVWALDADRLHGVPHVGDGEIADGAGPIAACSPTRLRHPRDAPARALRARAAPASPTSRSRKRSDRRGDLADA